MSSPRPSPAWHRFARWCSWFVPLLFGLRSLRLGQDSNWDLQNYHLYNPFALLHGKHAIDLAPAGMQSWFNPSLDFPYYLAVQALPAPVVAFAMGMLHGLAFPLLVVIARGFVPMQESARALWPFILAAAGVLGANFLSSVGNSMGDNTTALLVLGAIAVLARNRADADAPLRIDPRAAALSGLLLGLAIGLKLTNAIYGLGLVAAMVIPEGTVASRARRVAGCALAAAAGALITGGWWHLRMAVTLGNPLFPQFAALFPNDLTLPVMVADLRFLPHGLSNQLLWPFLFSIEPRRVSELPIRQLVWPAWYAATVGWILVRPTVARTRVAFLVVLMGVSYVAWQLLFSIYRYLTAAELLLPLALFAMLTSLAPGRVAKVAWMAVVGASLSYYFASSSRTWDHAPLAADAYEVQVPPIDASRTFVALVTLDWPRAWMVTRFPPQVSFAWLGSNLLEGPGYRRRLQELMAQRPAHFVVLDAAEPGQADPAAFDARARNAADRILARYGLSLEASACKAFDARIGRAPHPYQWCPLRGGNG